MKSSLHTSSTHTHNMHPSHDNTLSSQSRTEMLHNIDDTGTVWALRINDWKLIYAEGGDTRYTQGWYDTPQVDGDTRKYALQLATELQRHAPNASVSQHQIVDDFKYSEVKSIKGYTNDINVDIELKNRRQEEVFETDLDAILTSIGRLGARGSPYVVECGEKPANASTACDVSKAPCLFDIKHDPCEYLNRAAEFPDDVTAMLSRLKYYRSMAVAPRNKAIDPRGFPSRHGGIWTSWETL